MFAVQLQVKHIRGRLVRFSLDHLPGQAPIIEGISSSCLLLLDVILISAGVERIWPFYFFKSAGLSYRCACQERSEPLLSSLSQYWKGGRRFHVRASNEGSPRPRVARAQGIARLPFFLFPPFLFPYSSSPVLEGVAKVALDCAHRTRAVPIAARSASKEGTLAAPSPTLASPSPPPVQYPLLRLTPWLSDSFLSVSV